ncbi:MAG: DUF1801 domain-containing protein [Candidatus Bathyarchaeota archaeon]|nr:DUF1801 domain-containing protein [Candidatus Bathyarchaeota archaeon]
MVGLNSGGGLGSSDKKVDAYIGKLLSPQKELCQTLRELIHRTLPEVKEAMKWGVPTFGDGKFYIVALKEHVNLGFSIAGLSAEELTLLGGGGKTMKHLEIAETKDIDEEKIVHLLTLVNSKS